jgi:catechol 2,3-dioxygenase-like lactoylglutathione lyase family enzyme
MKPKTPNKLFPLFVTSKLPETKAFYEGKAGFHVTVDRPMYLQVQHGDADGPELCFMKPEALPDGKSQAAFPGKGVMVSVPVQSADEKYAVLKQAGVPLLDAPSDKPWGWRSFLAVDPNGVLLDFFHVYKHVDPSAMPT